MKRRLVWALPAIFAASAAVSLVTAHADVAALLAQIEGVLVTDAAQFVPAALLNHPEPVNVTDSNQFTPARLLSVIEPIKVSDAESFPDSTPPVITVPATIVAEATSPNGAAVSFTATANDPDNGVVPVLCSPASGSTFPLGSTTVGCSASDPAGNLGKASFTVQVVDTTTPVITASAVTLDDGKAYTPGSWTNQTVRVGFTCTDSASGVDPASITAPVTLSSEGQNQSVGGSCGDRSGNAISMSFGPVNIDKTAPTITYQGQTPAPNANGWNNTSVTLNWACADALSGSFATSVVTSITTEGTNQSATRSCADNAGNTSTDTRAGINIDTTAPTLNASASTTDGKPYASGTWTGQNVTVSFICTDDRSGVATVTGPITVSSEGSNQSASGDCSDRAANAASRITFAGINIDRTPPVTGFTTQPGPLNGRQLATVAAHVAVTPGAVVFNSTCYDSFGLNALLTVTDNLAGATSIKYGSAPIVVGKPLPNPALDHTIAAASATISFLSSGAYVLTYAAVDSAGNQDATQTRWIFVSTALGVSCATAPIPVSSLPKPGTVTVTGSLKIGAYNLPFTFGFNYPSR
jgi:hypothetical protein